MARKLFLIIFCFFIIIFFMGTFLTEANIDTEIQDVEETEQFTVNMAIISLIVIFLIIMYITEPIRIDFIALSIPVLLVILQRWTGVSVQEALSGFANEATITVLAMFILSAGVYRSGIVQLLVEKLEKITGKNEKKQIGIISGLSGLIAGVINNTPVVALFIPMVKELARKTRTSPSTLLMPLSFGAMMGGMLTLIGTNTNLLASNISDRLIGRSFTVFEFTRIGFLSLLIGLLYLITIGRHLIPERLSPEDEITDEYEMAGYLTEVRVRENSPLIGQTINDFFNFIFSFMIKKFFKFIFTTLNYLLLKPQKAYFEEIVYFSSITWASP